MVMRGGSRIDPDDLLPLRESAGHPGMYLDLASQSSIEGETELAGHDLHDHDVARMAQPAGGEIERCAPGDWFRQGQVRPELHWPAAGGLPARDHGRESGLQEWNRN